MRAVVCVRATRRSGVGHTAKNRPNAGRRTTPGRILKKAPKNTSYECLFIILGPTYYSILDIDFFFLCFPTPDELQKVAKKNEKRTWEIDSFTFSLF